MAPNIQGAALEAHHTAHHPPHLKHHFTSSEQQFGAAKLGMWLFLVTEILLFSGMFVAYAVYRVWHPEVFAVASEVLDPVMGGINTIVLLASSLTVALSIYSAQTDDQKATVRYLVATVALAAVFLIVKYFEYTAKFEHGVFPGASFDPHGDYARYNIPYAAQFFSIYFVMTGIHGVHVVVGMVLISIMAFRAHRGHFSSAYYTPVEVTGLYWHLVDIIWIFLFPLLYLIH
jgi:cytochrome c oxidase subunit 3